MKKKDKKLNARKEADKMLKGVIQDMNTLVSSTLKQKLKKLKHTLLLLYSIFITQFTKG